tara:strand:+ start:233 stop:679 length:447 start_codon:yes stop_codon:yes gene_type:complete
MNIEKITRIISALLGILGIVFLFLVLGKSDSEIKMAASMGDFSAISPIVNLAVAIILIAVIVTLLFSLLGLLSDMQKLKKASISIVALIIVVGISYAMSSGVETPLKDNQVLSAFQSRLVETGIRSGYLLAFIAIFSMILSGVKRLIK